MLTTLLPIRDRRERVVGYSVSACPSEDRGIAGSPDDDARGTLDVVAVLARLAGRGLIVPVTPLLVRDGSLTRFASLDAVWLLATDALDDAPTRKAVDRLIGTGFHFALDGFPDGEPLLPSLMGATITLDAQRTSAATLESRVRMLLEAGLRPLIRGVDDRVTRRRVVAIGAPLYTGRLLTRAASTPVDRTAQATALRAINLLASYADGRPPNATFDDFVRDEPTLSAWMLRSVRSASFGARGPRSVEYALNLLGREAVLEQLVGVTAQLLGEAAHDPELAQAALRRARICERVGAALDEAPHPRARALAGLMSVLEFALGLPPVQIVAQLDLSPMLQDTLLDRREPLGALVDIVDAMEYGWWDDLRSRCARLGMAPVVVGQAWTDGWRAAREELGFARTDVS